MPHFVAAGPLNMKYHVASIFTEATPQSEVTKSDLSAYWTKIWSEALDPTQPLWQFQHIENFEGGKSALLFRVHHSYGDGIAFVSFLLEMMDKKGSGGLSASVGMKLPKWYVLAAAMAAKFIGWFAFTILRTADQSVLHGPELTGKRKVAITGGLDLERVKAVKNRLKCSFNDVLMSSMAGAMHRYKKRFGTTTAINDLVCGVEATHYYAAF